VKRNYESYEQESEDHARNGAAKRHFRLSLFLHVRYAKFKIVPQDYVNANESSRIFPKGA